jgi:hypothetical protein
MDPGGDERVGYFIAGGILLVLGWGFGVFVNLLLHEMAGGGGTTVGWVRITSSMGPYAWAVLAFGLVTGTLGAGLLALGRASPKGPLVLPGYNY